MRIWALCGQAVFNEWICRGKKRFLFTLLISAAFHYRAASAGSLDDLFLFPTADNRPIFGMAQIDRKRRARCGKCINQRTLI
jgi:hypothetical protein